MFHFFLITIIFIIMICVDVGHARVETSVCHLSYFYSLITKIINKIHFCAAFVHAFMLSACIKLACSSVDSPGKRPNTTYAQQLQFKVWSMMKSMYLYLLSFLFYLNFFFFQCIPPISRGPFSIGCNAC